MPRMTRTGERGIALVFTLFLMAALSALAVSLMFLSQTETSSTRNYRTMSQARYAGEAGVHKAINYLINSYPVPTSTTGYDSSSSPVKYSSNPVVLSFDTTASNYPDSAVVTAFSAAAQGSLAVGAGTVTYATAATLVSIRQVTVYGGGNYIIQTWQITSEGTVPGPMPATVEVTAMLERNFVAADTYAVFATGSGCGAITLAGNVDTDSYDSTDPTSMATTPPTTDESGGAVGTNGNLNISGGVDVHGNLDTPRTGVGACNAGTPTAFTGTGHAEVGSIVQLPQPKVYPPPAAPVPTPPLTTQSITTVGGCAAIISANSATQISNPLNCVVSGSTLTVTTNGSTPVLMGNVTLGSNVNVTIQYGNACSSPCSPTAGTGTAMVNVNSFNLGSNSSVTIGANTAMTMNVAGTSLSGGTLPVDFSGGTIVNTSYDPSKFQILYAGTDTIKIVGGAAASAMVYAPNADIVKHGSGGFYGSILGETFVDQAGQASSVHYDRSLSSKFFTLGNYVMTSFSWKKY